VHSFYLREYILTLLRYLHILDTMSSLVNQMIDDLKRTTPENPIVLENSYNDNLTMELNVQRMYRHLLRSLRIGDRILSLVYAYYIGELSEVTALTHERTTIKRIVTPYYFEVIRHLYNVYEPLGVEQIYRTKDLKITHFRKISRPEVNRLRDEAIVDSPACLTNKFFGEELN